MEKASKRSMGVLLIVITLSVLALAILSTDSPQQKTQKMEEVAKPTVADKAPLEETDTQETDLIPE